MGGDEGEGAAPGGDRFGDAIEQGLVFVEGKFIEFDVTAFAGEGVWVGGDGIDAAARGEFEDVSREGVIAGVNDLTIGFASSIVGAGLTYYFGLRTLVKEYAPPPS